MEYSEAPSITNVDRRLVFPLIKWLTKEKFIEDLKSVNLNQIHPHMNVYENENDPFKRVYIGKSIPMNRDEGIRNPYSYYEQNSLNLEILGTVSRDLNGDWSLKVPYASDEHIIKKDFLVLSIQDPSSFEWIKTRNGETHTYSLRGAIDHQTNEYFYIGRNQPENNEYAKPRYYEFREFHQFNEPVPPLFGKIHPSHRCLYVPFDNKELALQDYDILCLRPSPAPLKILTRLEIRKSLKFSDENIQRINKNKNGMKHIPDTLLKFLKYPNSLTVGEFMLKDEKIVSEDGKFELQIQNNGDLVCRSLINNKDELNERDLIDLENTQLRRVIHNAVHSVWLHRFQVCLHLNNNKVHVLHTFLINPQNIDFVYKKEVEFRVMQSNQ